MFKRKLEICLKGWFIMRATEILKRDHREMLLAAAILNEMCRRVEDNIAVDAEDLRKLADYVLEFGFRYHGANESVLFAALREHGVDEKTTALGRLQGDHDIYIKSMEGMLEALEDIEQGNISAWESIIREARYVIKHLEDHMKQEEYALYYMADIYLPEEEQERLLSRFNALEKRLIASGKRAHFDRILSTLGEKYRVDTREGIYDFGLLPMDT